MSTGFRTTPRGRMMLVLLASGLAGCAGRTDTPSVDSTQVVAAAAATPEILLELERGACFGQCPEYTVRLSGDGQVRYRGLRNTAVTGEQVATVDAAAVRRVHAALVAAGVSTADSAYTSGHPSCTAYIADLPTLVLTVLVEGTRKRIVYDPGCPGAPAFLSEFPARIDSLAGTAAWVRGPSEKTP